MAYETATEATRIDPTLSRSWCSTCQEETAQGYIGHGSNGCVRCHPVREVSRWKATPRPVTAPEPISEIPDWMTE